MDKESEIRALHKGDDSSIQINFEFYSKGALKVANKMCSLIPAAISYLR